MTNRTKNKFLEVANEQLTFFKFEERNDTLRDLWIFAIDTISSLRKDRIYDTKKLHYALKNAVIFSNKKDVTMVQFWLDQFAFSACSIQLQKIRRQVLQNTLVFRFSYRNTLVASAYELLAFSDKIKRVIYTR